MKLDAIDHRKPVTVNLRLEAAIYDLAQQYKAYAASQGSHYKTDGQLIAAIVDAFVRRGDNDFRAWLRAQQHQPALKAEKKPTQKTNGVDLAATAQFSVEDAQK
jgi:hypothetical protein